jgi:hypothetical protein
VMMRPAIAVLNFHFSPDHPTTNFFHPEGDGTMELESLASMADESPSELLAFMKVSNPTGCTYGLMLL